MKTTQPNFEIIKREVYRLAMKDTPAIYTALCFERIHNTAAPHSHKRIEMFKADLNQYLDRYDIRRVNTLIDLLIEKKATIPNWIKNKSFVIDYNNNMSLDLIKTT